MIFTSIYSDYDKQGLHPVLKRCIDFLKETNFDDMEVGVYELEGKDIYYQVIETKTEPFEDRSAESHNDYLDVQFVVSGEEKLGFTPWKEEYKVKEYYEERDLMFYEAVENEGYIHATPGCVSIFFPHDVHKPQIAVNEPADEKKVVVKVKVSLLND